MKEISAKFLFDTFCKKFAILNYESTTLYCETKLFPTTLIIEFTNRSEIIFYPEETEWIKMSSYSLKKYYSENTDYNYAYEQNAIIMPYEYDFNSIDFENLKKQFEGIQNDTGFSYISSIIPNRTHFTHIIALTHFEQLTFQTPSDYENLIFNHTLNAILNSYNQYQKSVFSKLRLNKKIHTFTLGWYESNFSYNLCYGSEPIDIIKFSQALYTKTDIELMLSYTKSDQEAFFSIWLILYRVCTKLKEALTDNSLFLSNFKCYPTFFDNFHQIEEYTTFAKKYKDLSTTEYIELVLKELKIPEYL